jgi:hypothetical protein
MKLNSIHELMDILKHSDPKYIHMLMKTDVQTILALKRVAISYVPVKESQPNFNIYFSMYRYANQSNPFSKIRKKVFISYLIQFLNSISPSKFKWRKLKLLNQQVLHILFVKFFEHALIVDEI